MGTDPAEPTWLAFPVTPAKGLMASTMLSLANMPAVHAKLLHQAGRTVGQSTDSAPEKKMDWNVSKMTKIEKE